MHADAVIVSGNSNWAAVPIYFAPLAMRANSQQDTTLRLGHTKLVFTVYPLRKSRGMIEIMANILETCLEGTKRTRIMYRANLTSRSIKSYLKVLIEQEMLEKSDLYRTTVKGRIYLEYFKGILILLGKGDAQ